MPTDNFYFFTKISDHLNRILQILTVIVLLAIVNTLNAKISPEQNKTERDLTTMTQKVDIKTSVGMLHVEIHFNASDISLALRARDILEKSAPKIVNYFKHVPKNAVHILISDATSANGMATVFPRNLIVLNNYPPTGRNHLITIDDWFEGLIIHEFVHIIHLDQTRGFNRVMTTIFGSIGKLGGVVPTWFTEGIAVWAETHFTNGGRLRNPLMLHQFHQTFLTKNSCMEIDCLSNPNHYPYRQFAYWAGAYFLDALEREKPGVIRCIVQQNSSNLPGVLNSAFLRCAGNTATNLYKRFAQNMFKKSQNKAVAGLRTGLPNYQKNHLVINDYYVNVHNQKRRDFIIKESIRTRYKETIKIEQHIDELIQPTTYSQQKHQLIFLGSDVPGGRGKNKVFKLNLARDRKKRYNVEKIKLDKSYVSFYELKKDHYYGVSYEDSQFVLYEIMGDSQNNIEKEIYRFPMLTHLHHFEFIEGDNPSFYMMMTENKNYSIVRFDINTKEIFKLYSSTLPIRQFGNFGTYKLIENDGKKFILNFASQASTITPLKDDANFIVDMRGNENFCIYLSENRRSPLMLNLEDTCQDSVAKFANGKPQKLEITPYEFTKIDDTVIAKDKDPKLNIENYNSFKHLLPHYWMGSYLLSQRVSVFSFFTTLSDPKNIQNIGVGFERYFTFSKTTPRLSYTLRTGPVFWTLHHYRSYTVNPFSDDNDVFRSQGASVSSFLPVANFTIAPNLFYNKQSVEDFISTRDLKQYGLSFTVKRERNHVDSLFQGFSWYLKAYQQKNSTGISFYGGETKIQNRFRLLEKLHFDITGAYGKLFKDDLASGILYGGGSVTHYPQAFHEFYGIDYNDAFGRRMATARGQLDWTLLSPYSAGGGLVPFYLKDIKILLGMDMINSEWVYVDGELHQNKELKSTHVGLRLTWDLFYLVPVELDIIHSKVSKYQKKETLFLFKGEYKLF